ncbi:MAG: PAS domain S-box protein [Candidatus Marinimicrobia bacterium]|nr:PAS domain S-box protein [Candidatus Neomarinimicrobiota bacterium]
MNLSKKDLRAQNSEIEYSHELMQYIIEHSRSAIAVHDKDLKYIYVSRRYLEEYGVQEQDVIGKHHYDIFPDLPQKWRDVHQRVLAGEILSAEDDPYPRADGRVDWTRWECRPWYESDGSIGGIIVYTEVITERKQAEIRLAESEERFRNMFQKHNAIMLLINPESGKIIDSNNAAVSFYGYSSQQLSELRIQDINQLSDDEIAEEMRKVLNQSKNYFIFPHKLANGKIRTVEVHSTPMEIDNNTLLFSIVNDITKRKQAEKTIQKQQYYLEKAQEMGSIGTWELDIKENVLIWTEENYRIFGVPIGTPLTYEIFFNQVHPEDRDHVNHAWMAALEGKPYDIEHRLLINDKVKWVREKADIDFDENRKAVRGIGFTQDISDRKNTELALVAEKTTAQKYLDIAGVMIVSLNAEGKITLINKKGCEILGYSYREIINKDWFKLCIPEEEREMIKGVFQKLFEGKMELIEYYESSVITKEGETRVIAFHNSVIRDENSQITHILSSGEDITERKLSERMLKEVTDRYAMAMNATKDGIFDWNLVTNEIYYSPGWKGMLGFADDELANDFSIWEQLTAPEDVERSWKMQTELINRKRDRFEIEFKMKHKDGHWVDILSRANAVFDDTGQAIRIVGTHIDISERKRAEAEKLALESQLLRSQKLEAIGTMAGGIAHDLNNILQELYLYTGILKDRLPADEQLHSIVQNIKAAEYRASDLVSQMLTFSRREKTELKPVKIQNLLKEALTLIRASTPSTIEINHNIDTDCGAVLGNVSQVPQVIINLCNNAVHAMRDGGGTLSVSLREVDALIKTEAGEVVPSENGVVELMVNDTGHGMDSETLDLIFDPFFTTKDVNEGTGLGLSMVHGIVKSMHGQIEVMSEPAKGTSIRVLFPITAEQEQQSGDPAEAPRKPSRALKIIFVDDDAMIANAGKLILEAEGHIVDTAKDGHEALELFQKEASSYDLIITDLTMPRVTGLELGNAVRELSADVLLVLISGNLDPKLQSEFELHGFNAFLRKPWTATELISMINSLELGRHSQNPGGS